MLSIKEYEIAENFYSYIVVHMMYTGVSSLVHYLLCHVTAYAFRRKFGPLSFSPENTPNFMIIRIILFEDAGLVHIT